MSHSGDYRFPDCVIQVFCKAPVAGTVKTRLTPGLSAEQAADVHKFLSEKTVRMLADARICPLELWCSPDEDHPFFRRLQGFCDLPLHVQQGEDLGQRMLRALSQGLKRYRHVLLIVTYCPSFEPQDFAEAVEALKRHSDIVIAPVEDGGYSLIGMNQPYSGLFEGMRWSHDGVFQETLSRIHVLELSCHQLRLQWDVDTAEDWDRVRGISLHTSIETIKNQ